MDVRYLFARYTWVVNYLLLVLLAIVTARTLNNQLADSFLQAGQAMEIIAPAVRPPGPKYSPPVHAIVARDLFDVTRIVDPPPQKTEPGIKSAILKLKLMGIAFFKAGHPWNLATINNLARREIGLFRKGDKVAGDSTLHSIKHDRVVIERNGGALEEFILDPPITFADPTPAPTVPPDPFESIKRDGEDRFIIPGRIFERHLKDPSGLITKVRMIPNYVGNGDDRRIDGFRMYQIRPGSIFQKMGFKNGDVLKAINGHGLESLESALGLFQSLRHETDFTVEIERRTNLLEFHYSVQ